MPAFGVSVQLGNPVPPPLRFVKQIDWYQANPPQFVPWFRHIVAHALARRAAPTVADWQNDEGVK